MLSPSCMEKLLTCHPDLQRLVNLVDKDYPVLVICGYRGEEAQNAAYAKGSSKLKFPKSKHNKTPSLAVDLAPLPLNWEDINKFKEMCWYVKGVATGLGIKIKSGGLDWYNFSDYPHFEIEGDEV